MRKLKKEQLGELILASESQLYATAMAILENDVDCADAIEETIVKAFSKIDSLRNDRYAKTWLMRILINECHNIGRQKSREELLEDDEAIALEQTDETRNYSELYRAVNELKEDLKMPVILYYMEDYSIKEIAQILETTEGTIQKRLARARHKLKLEINLEEIFE